MSVKLVCSTAPASTVTVFVAVWSPRVASIVNVSCVSPVFSMRRSTGSSSPSVIVAVVPLPAILRLLRTGFVDGSSGVESS
jgi:hypothetical protein